MKKKWFLILSLFLFEAPVFATIQQQSIVNQIVVKKKMSLRAKMLLLLTIQKSTPFQEQVPLFQKDSTECVKISLKNGKTFYGIIKKMTTRQLLYVPCSQPSMEPLDIYTEDVATLTDANGKIYYQYTAETERANAKTKSKISIASALIGPFFLYLYLIGKGTTIILLGAIFFPLIGLVTGISYLSYMLRKKYKNRMLVTLTSIATAVNLILGLIGPFVILILATLLICLIYYLLTFNKS